MTYKTKQEQLALYGRIARRVARNYVEGRLTEKEAMEKLENNLKDVEYGED